jgi:hypothetical protein
MKSDLGDLIKHGIRYIELFSHEFQYKLVIKHNNNDRYIYNLPKKFDDIFIEEQIKNHIKIYSPIAKRKEKLQKLNEIF